MRRIPVTMMCAITLAALSACGEQGQPPAAEDAAPQADVPPPAQQTNAPPEPTSDMGLTAARQKAGEAAESAALAGRQALDAASEAAGILAERGNELAAAVTERGREMVADVRQYLAENDLDSAQGVLDKLKGIRGALPESVQGEIDRLQQRIDNMRAGGEAPAGGSEPSDAATGGGGSGT